MPSSDLAILRRALKLAMRGEGHTRPNPPVGAVIAVGDKVIGEGWHRRAGGDHAEVAAIADAMKKGAVGKVLRKATLYVTLEPCSRPGRVGACTDAIAKAGIRRVVYAIDDPNPANRGRATSVLAACGIDCRRFAFPSSREESPFLRLLAPFTKHVTKNLPYVTVKIAMSLDGRICDRSGDAKWISGPQARRVTGRLRERVDAIMVGAETVRRDDPSLLSHGRANGDLLRVVVTRSGKLPAKSQIFTDGKNETLVIRSDGTAASLRKAMARLAGRGIMHVLCEGGLKLAVSLAEAGLVDEWLTVLSPCIVGNRPISRKIALSASGCRRLAEGETMLGFEKLAEAAECSRD